MVEEITVAWLVAFTFPCLDDRVEHVRVPSAEICSSLVTVIGQDPLMERDTWRPQVQCFQPGELPTSLEGLRNYCGP